MQSIVRKKSCRKGWYICPPNNNRSGLPEARHGRAIFSADQILKCDHAICRRSTCKIGINFYRNGHAVKRPQRVPFFDCLISLIRSFKGLILKDVNNRIDSWVYFLKSVETARGHVSCTNLPRPNSTHNINSI
jgi:hypothetical protein